VVDAAKSALVGEKYELLGRLGAGGMGEVWEARHHVTGRRVAVKLLRADTRRRDEAAKRFLREAQAIGRLEHPHVVEVLDAGIDPATKAPYIVQALLRGVSLRRYLRTRTRLEPLEAASVVAPVLRGLSAAHVAGIVHRDIKPSNVILCRQPDDALDAVTPKIIDFGISKLEEGEETDSTLSTLTASGVALGTIGYMAPEQAEGRADVDGRADLWAAGVMLFEMVAGRRPFDGSSTAQTLLRIVSQDAPPLDALGLEVSRGFVDVVVRALARKPTDRFLSALDMLEALEGAVGTPLRSTSIVLPGASMASLLPDEDEAFVPVPVSPTAETAPGRAHGTPEDASSRAAGTTARGATVPAWVAWSAGAVAFGAIAVALLRTPSPGDAASSPPPDASVAVDERAAPDAFVGVEVPPPSTTPAALTPATPTPLTPTPATPLVTVPPPDRDRALESAGAPRSRREPRRAVGEEPDAGGSRVGANGAAILGAE
jgi:serine/threonine protein kinase